MLGHFGGGRVAGSRRPQECGGMKKCPVLENPGQNF